MVSLAKPMAKNNSIPLSPILLDINALLFGWLDTPMNDFPSDIKKQLDFISLDKATDKIIEYMYTKK